MDVLTGRQFGSFSNSLRTTRSASLSTLSSATSSEFLGVEGQPFSFDQLDCTVDFLECSGGGADKDDGMQDVIDWIEQSE